MDDYLPECMDPSVDDIPEKEEWLEVFSLFDQNGDGNIKTSDLGNVLRGLGRIPTEEILQSIIEEVDTDGNSSVDVNEFIMVMKKYPREDPDPRLLRDCLEGLTHKDKNLIDLCQFRHFLTNLGEKLTMEEMWELEKKLVPDGDGNVSIDSFISALCYGN